MGLYVMGGSGGGDTKNVIVGIVEEREEERERETERDKERQRYMYKERD